MANNLSYFKKRIDGDFLTTGLWDLNDDPVYANITDIDPLTGLQQLTGWGVNENLKEFANAITDIHTGLAFTPQAAVPSGAGEPLQTLYGLWLSSVDDNLHFKSVSGDKILATLDDIIVLICKNVTGVQLDKQDMVYISGCDGVNGEISLADNTDPAKQYWVGMVVADIANGATGTVRLIGELSGLNTIGFGDGDILYLSTAGALVNVIPSTGTVKPVGYCLCSHASLGKVLLVDIDYPYISAISEDIDIRMGDAAGLYGADFRDSTDTGVAFIDSNGVAYFDVMNEFTGAAGVTIEGVLLKDSEITLPISKALYFDAVGSNYLYVNVGGEITLVTDSNFLINAVGSVEIDAVDLQVDNITEYTLNAGVTIETMLFKDGIIAVDTINESSLNAGVTIEGVLHENTDIWMADNARLEFGNVYATPDFYMWWDNGNSIFRMVGELVEIQSASEGVGAYFDQVGDLVQLWNSAITLDLRAGGVGINQATPLGTLHVKQTSLTGAVPTLCVEQIDVSEGTINFIGSARGVITGPTGSADSIRVELNGTVYRLALYADA